MEEVKRRLEELQHKLENVLKQFKKGRISANEAANRIVSLREEIAEILVKLQSDTSE
jgi:exonuclease VII small subunit